MPSHYNPLRHHRRSVRLKGYNYSGAGLYFITICVKNRACLFGKIVNGEMQLNDAGNMIGKWYNELEHKFPDVRCDAHIVMPNHFHCIVENVGANLRVCPPAAREPVSNGANENVLGEPNENILGEPNENILGEHIGSPLQRIMQWFKTMTTNEYIRNVKNNQWQPFDGKLWQRNYYEHIIRNDESYNRIRNYILNNPKQWQADTFNPNKKIHEQ